MSAHTDERRHHAGKEHEGHDLQDGAHDVVTNTDQTIQNTVIHWTRGSRRQALDVAKIVGVGRSALKPMDENARVLGADRAQ